MEKSKISFTNEIKIILDRIKYDEIAIEDNIYHLTEETLKSEKKFISNKIKGIIKAYTKLNKLIAFLNLCIYLNLSKLSLVTNYPVHIEVNGSLIGGSVALCLIKVCIVDLQQATYVAELMLHDLHTPKRFFHDTSHTYIDGYLK